MSGEQNHKREDKARCEIFESLDFYEMKRIATAELKKKAYLAEFIRSVRRKDGDYCESSSLRCLVSSIERYLNKNTPLPPPKYHQR